MSKPAARLPGFLIALDVLGTLILVLGLLGALDIDIGLPVLGRIWPFLVVLGIGLMVPLIVGVVLTAQKARR